MSLPEKTARSCDGCRRRRARWYCAADDAFLCHPCDNSVHSANPLARRHDRVRIKSNSWSAACQHPTWHHACKRKARSPRGPPKDKTEDGRPETPVPGITEPAPDEEEQLLYRVTVFDPAPSTPPLLSGRPQPSESATGFFIPPDIDLDGFEIDVENLLGETLDEDAFCLDIFTPEEGGSYLPVKEEVDDDERSSADNSRFDGEISDVGHAYEEKPEITGDPKRRNIMLSLDYEKVITVWSTQGCPWTDGRRPQLDLDGCWTSNVAGIVRGTGDANGGREARVSRYREKRRTRLFSKKIRYEVRKLNAEKRPRMKGRFVKRSSSSGTNDASTN